MAEEKATAGLKPVSPEETEVSFHGPAFMANRFFIHVGPSAVRISFAEQSGPDAKPFFRTAVAMPFQDAIQLVKVLGTLMAPIEAEITKAEAQGKKDG